MYLNPSPTPPSPTPTSFPNPYLSRSSRSLDLHLGEIGEANIRADHGQAGPSISSYGTHRVPLEGAALLEKVAAVSLDLTKSGPNTNPANPINPTNPSNPTKPYQPYRSTTRPPVHAPTYPTPPSPNTHARNSPTPSPPQVLLRTKRAGPTWGGGVSLRALWAVYGTAVGGLDSRGHRSVRFLCV